MKNEAHYKKVVIGSAGTPLPMWDGQNQTMGALAREADKVLFYTTHKDRSRSGSPDVVSESDRITTQDRVYAELMRLLPTRSMLPYLQHELVERDPNRVDWDKHSFLAGYMGAPSIGKSFMLKTLGKLVHPKGCLYLNCKDIDMGTIFCETVFDTSAANKEKATIDAKILQGNADPSKGLKADSISALKHALGDAFVEEDRDGVKVTSIDWNGVKVKGETPEAQGYQKQVIREAIRQVCQNEGITMTNGAGNIGITTRDGIAIRAADPKSADYGRPILLDELNTAKRGTIQKLYEYFAMLSDPKVETFEVQGGENRPFTFRRKELPATYRVNFTGNPKAKGLGDREDFDRALASRFGRELDLITVPDPAMQDFADRIAQSITGVPLAQIYYSAQEQFERNPDLFVKVLKAYRLNGLTDVEKVCVPEEEILNINNAKKILQLSEQLAEFFDGLKQMVNPDSPYHRQHNTSLSPEYADYLSGVEIDLRLVTKLLEKASVVQPQSLKSEMVDYGAIFSGKTEAAESTEIDSEDRLATRGERLERYMGQWLKQVLIPADADTRGISTDECKKLYDLAMKHAANSGLGDPKLKEASRGSVLPVKDLYNLNLMSEPGHQASKLRDVLVDLVHTRHPDMKTDGNRDEIITVAQVERALAQLAQVRSVNLPAHTTAVVVPNTDADSFIDSPFTQVLAKDAIPAKGEKAFEPGADSLVLRDALLTALAVPTLAEKTLPALWNQALATHTEAADESVKIAQATSASGIGLTSLMVQHDGKPEPVHVLHDKKSNKSIIVGGHVDSKTRRLLERNGTTYVDYTASNAASLVNQAVNSMLEGGRDRDKTVEQIKGAFLMRNGFEEEGHKNWGKSLGDLMTQPHEIPPIMPIYVTEMQSLDELKHLQAQLDRGQGGKNRAGGKA